MPLYDYYCPKCGEIKQAFYKIADKPDGIPCDCGQMMRQQMTVGGTKDSTPPWIRERTFQEAICNTDFVKMGLAPKLETREDVRRHCQAHGLTMVNGI